MGCCVADCESRSGRAQSAGAVGPTHTSVKSRNQDRCVRAMSAQNASGCLMERSYISLYCSVRERSAGSWVANGERCVSASGDARARAQSAAAHSAVNPDKLPVTRGVRRIARPAMQCARCAPRRRGADAAPGSKKRTRLLNGRDVRARRHARRRRHGSNGVHLVAAARGRVQVAVRLLARHGGELGA